MLSLCAKKTEFLVILFLLFSGFEIEAQNAVKEFPKIGDTVPAFILDDLHYYSKKQTTSQDLKGKSIILDFFSIGCKACFFSFPHVDSIKKEFEGKVQFFLVGKNSPGLQKQYENYMKNYGLDLPVDYDDSTIWNQFGIYQVPTTFWIDAEGIIRQISTANALTRERINQFLQGKPQSLVILENQKDFQDGQREIKLYGYRKPFLIAGNGGADSSYLYRSILSKWDFRTVYADVYISSKNKNRVEEIGENLNDLFLLAYGDTMPFIIPSVQRDVDHLPNHYGQWAVKPLDESSRSDLFQFDVDTNKNMYRYSLVLPDSNNSGLHLQHIMQRDLMNYFSLSAKVETRKLPCWKIISLKNAESLLKTKGGEPDWKSTFDGVSFRNQPVHSLLVEIWSYFQYEPVFIDETGINYHIDLKIDAVMTDINEVKKELRKNGLDLVKGEKEMKVVVIRDALD